MVPPLRVAGTAGKAELRPHLRWRPGAGELPRHLGSGGFARPRRRAGPRPPAEVPARSHSRRAGEKPVRCLPGKGPRRSSLPPRVLMSPFLWPTFLFARTERRAGERAPGPTPPGWLPGRAARALHVGRTNYMCICIYIYIYKNIFVLLEGLCFPRGGRSNRSQSSCSHRVGTFPALCSEVPLIKPVQVLSG